LLVDVKVMEENLDVAFLPSRVAATLIGAFGLLGLILASAGMYALIAYTAGHRKKEIGIRMAIGASRTSVLRMILLKAVKLAIHTSLCSIRHRRRIFHTPGYRHTTGKWLKTYPEHVGADYALTSTYLKHE
jgi:hypothetical protein